MICGEQGLGNWACECPFQEQNREARLKNGAGKKVYIFDPESTPSPAEVVAY